MIKSKDKSGCECTLYVAWIAVTNVDIQVENCLKKTFAFTSKLHDSSSRGHKINYVGFSFIFSPTDVVSTDGY